MKVLYTGIILIILILVNHVGCSHEESIKQNFISVEKMKLNSWLNLMPGGKPSLNVSGEMRLKNNDVSEITNLQFELLSVYQNNKLVGSIKPNFAVNYEDDGDIIPTDTEKEYYFTAKIPSKLLVDFNADEPVEMKFLFRWYDKSYLHEIDNVEIMKVY